MIKRIFLSLILIVILIVDLGCSQYIDDPESIGSGEILTPEYMAEISQKLEEDKNSSSEASSSINVVENNSVETSSNTVEAETDLVIETTACEVTDNYITQSTLAVQPIDSITVSAGSEISDVVYWTEGGSVWHIKKDCSSLSRSKNIISGSESEAISAGKERVCKRCG